VDKTSTFNGSGVAITAYSEFVIKIRVNSLTAAKGVIFQLQDTVDDFTGSRVNHAWQFKGAVPTDGVVRSIHSRELPMLRKGVADAKLRLGRALKHAHGDLGSHELVAASLVALGALVEASGDGSQARDMLTSAFTLAKAAGDAAAQAGALALLARVHAGTGHAAEEAEMTRYAAKKRALVAAARTQAEAQERVHKRVLTAGSEQ
jgi:hypothetical protein